MYTVTAAYGIAKKHTSRWEDLPDILTEPVSSIFSTYRKVYLTLTAGFLPAPVFFDLDFFRGTYPNFEGTLDEMFTDNGTNNIDLLTEIPTPSPKYAQFSDAFRAGYKVTVMIDDSLRLHRDKTDPVAVYEHCLFTVNGLLHKSDTDGEYTYVLGGNKSAKISKRNQLGIWSFINMAKLRSHSITNEMITRQHDSSTFSDRTYIKVPEATNGKTVLMSLGGYLVRPHPEIFFPVGNDVYCLVTSRLPLLERYYETSNIIDYSSLNLDRTTTNPDQISLEQFYSDEVMSKYITLPQSFIIVLDKEDIFFNEEYINVSRLPGMYVAYKEPQYPLFTGAGKISEYWTTTEDGQYSVNVADGNLHNRIFKTIRKKEAPTVTNDNNPAKTYHNSRAYFLELGSDF